MNRSRIEYCDYTWNPVTGCLHDCPYCYARKQTLRFGGDIRLNLNDPRCEGDKEKMLLILREPFAGKNDRFSPAPFGFYPTLHTYRLDWIEKLKTGATIFVCSMADLFGAWVPDEWILKVFEACRKFPQHNYLFLTKAPGRYQALLDRGLLPEENNFWYGSTATGSSATVFESERVNTFVSIEPILEPFAWDGGNTFPKVDWVIIGAETGNRRDKVHPCKEWIDDLILHYKAAATPVFLKNSLKALYGDSLLQEQPESLTLYQVSKKRKERQWSVCIVCKKERPMKEMIELSTRARRGEWTKQLGHACPECLEKLKRALQSDDILRLVLRDSEDV